MRSRTLSAGLLVSCAISFSQVPAKHNLTLDDIARVHHVADPRVSPDGQWVAYTVGDVDKEEDKHVSHLWMTSWDGKQTLQLTYGNESDSSPRWSPDGKYLSFVSARAGKAKGSQIWVLDRRGGEARQLTALKETERSSAYEWSPDSKKLLLLKIDSDEPIPDPAKPATPPKPKPAVIERYHFKQDMDGYITGRRFDQLFLYDIATGKMDRVTTFKAGDEKDPAWSPDGTKIAFVSNQDDDPDRSVHSDVWVVDARPGSTPRRLTTYPGQSGGRPAWSPDGKLVAFLQATDPKYDAYNMNRLAVASADGGGPERLIGEKLDRGASAPEFTADGRAVLALVDDDRSQYPARFAVSGKSYERLVGGKLEVGALSTAAGHTAVLSSTDEAAPEVYALEGGSLRKLTAQNDALMTELHLGTVEDIDFKSADGTEVHGMLMKPPSFEAGKKYPALLRIHGGPNGQDAHAFFEEHQWLAANGYLVISVNYRGSSGRGHAFGESIFADWGHHEVADLLAAVDHVLAMGIADPDRLGIGGWSYGGILTDYTIASDGRFKAAISGAGSANQISMYGSDQYVFQYNTEIGPPWKNPEAWVKISYPFFKADRIHTPTLFMGGDQDFNVPVIGGEQMYQALKTLNIPTELVIYPGQHHGITRPSFQRDRLERYVAWYDKYLKPSTAPKTASGS